MAMTKRTQKVNLRQALTIQSMGSPIKIKVLLIEAENKVA
jgi:ribosomal protein L28